MLMALFQNKESLSSNKTTRVCGQADKNVQLQARPRGLIGVRRDFNLLLHPIVIRRLTTGCFGRKFYRIYGFQYFCSFFLCQLVCWLRVNTGCAFIYIIVGIILPTVISSFTNS